MSRKSETWRGLDLTHWRRDKKDAILQTMFDNAISWMKMFESPTKISVKFVA